VVGDDAQAIYAFRGATVRNILDFPSAFSPAARVVTLEENYRSTQPILDAANAVIAQAPERFTKNLRAQRAAAALPRLVQAWDESAQVDYVVERVLAAREAGLPLQRQAVLFRAAHHSDALEVELARRNIPFVKYGGLKFLEAAHVKDTVCLLRWGENPRDEPAAFRALQLLPGIGPQAAQRAVRLLDEPGEPAAVLRRFVAPAAARDHWPGLCALLEQLRGAPRWPAELTLVRAFYQPHLERIYDHAQARAQDLDQLEQIAAQFASRTQFLSDLTLDPPQATGDFAGPPLLDEDYLILSTIHSAKGQEWDEVFILNCADGSIPSDMAAGSPASLEEERRLLYVAMTRAKDGLHLIHLLRFYIRQQRRFGDRHVYAPRSRFLPDELLDRFERVTHGGGAANDGPGCDQPHIDVGARLRAMWS
jgi:DNA helicase-2/ATP-dependent DNA helicase PcrA